MKLNTFIIDDDPVVVMILKRLLVKNGFTQPSTCFEGGEEALQNLKDNYNEWDVFIIFLDINMPLMSGWQFLDSVKDFTKPDNLLIIMLSSSICPKDELNARRNDYVLKFLSKPLLGYHVEEIKNMVEKRTNYIIG